MRSTAHLASHPVSRLTFLLNVDPDVILPNHSSPLLSSSHYGRSVFLAIS